MSNVWHNDWKVTDLPVTMRTSTDGATDESILLSTRYVWWSNLWLFLFLFGETNSRLPMSNIRLHFHKLLIGNMRLHFHKLPRGNIQKRKRKLPRGNNKRTNVRLRLLMSNKPRSQVAPNERTFWPTCIRGGSGVRNFWGSHLVWIRLSGERLIGVGGWWVRWKLLLLLLG